MSVKAQGELVADLEAALEDETDTASKAGSQTTYGDKSDKNDMSGARKTHARAKRTLAKVPMCRQ